MLAHPNILAQFNAWANKHLYAICGELSEKEITQNRGAFFNSIFGTLNHILLVDILYRERLEGKNSNFQTLDETLYDKFNILSAKQMEEDQRWVELTKGLSPESLEEKIGFWTLLDRPDLWKVPKHIYYTNLCQHQCHHRGQIHNMVSIAGLEPPPIGYIEFRIETDGSFIVTPDR